MWNLARRELANCSGVAHCLHSNPALAGCRWLMSVILTTQEEAIRNITLQSQPGQLVFETLFWKKPITQTGLVEWLKV
jgi:hypothetical protein